MTVFYAGLDLGQAADYTALVLIEHQASRNRLAIRHIERPELHTPYPAIVKHVAQLLHSPQLQGIAGLLVDATGVGRPVVDMFRDIELPCPMIPVTITAGVHASRDDRGMWHVPKRDLVGAIQIPLQEKRLVVADGLPLGNILKSELLNFKMKISATGHDSYEAGGASDWREGEHDDVVLAAALPCWWITRGMGNVPVAVEGGSVLETTYPAMDMELMPAEERERLAKQEQAIQEMIAQRSPAIQSFLDKYRLNGQ